MQNRMMITGAGSGLGREIALRWAREGWQLALSDVSDVYVPQDIDYPSLKLDIDRVPIFLFHRTCDLFNRCIAVTPFPNKSGGLIQAMSLIPDEIINKGLVFRIRYNQVLSPSFRT